MSTKTMQFLSITFLFLINFSRLCNANDCSNPSKVIEVSKNGQGKLTTIQSAIDSIPSNNAQWVHILIEAGNYTEKVMIPSDKPCVCLEGAGSSSTFFEWGDHNETASSYTFESNSDNVIIKGISFVNSYNHPPDEEPPTKQAIAGGVTGNKTAIYDCVFKSIQDTLFDDTGHHYYHNCYIQGAIDFIFGRGQSIFKNCTIYNNSGEDGRNGVIAAQRRDSEEETSEYVFNHCIVDGTRQILLGRAYGAYSRVIFTHSYLSSMVDPVGWNSWDHNDTNKITFVEKRNKGPGANKSKRVKWMKHMTQEEVNKFTDISYIDNEGWLKNTPSSFNLKNRQF